MKNIYQILTEEQKNLAQRVFNLALGRILKSVYLQLEDSNKKIMEEIFSRDNKKEKEKFIKKNLLKFKSLLQTEVKKLKKEIESEMKK